MFSSTFNSSIRLKLWNTNPISPFLTSVRSFSFRFATSVSLVFLSALLTGLGLYHRLARFGGAGTLVPITGFANSVVSPAVEFKAEGWITGVGAKIFTIAGPVLAFGTLASWVWGLVYWAMNKF